MGSTTHIVDETGEVQNRYEYDAWGNLTLCEEKIPNRFKFTGQQLDPITQQYYLRARFYNPVIARFTQEDTYRGDGLNLYAYCANNPVYYVDPSGFDKDALHGLDEIYKKFTLEEIESLKSTVISEGQMLKDSGLTNKELGPAIAGVYNKMNGKFYTAINSMDGSLPKELHPIIAERIASMPDDVLLSYTYTHGAGSHAEIYAVNKALLDGENVNIDDLLVYVNRTQGVSKPVTEIPFVTCPHCRYILEGFNILSNYEWG